MRCEPALLPVQGGRVVPGPAQDQSRHSDGGTQPHAMCSGMTLSEQGSWSRWPSVVPSILTHSVAWAGVLWPGTLQSTSRYRKLAKTLISALVFYSFLLSSALCYLCSKSLWIHAYQGKVWASPEFADPWLEEVSCGTELDANGALCLLRLDQDFAITCFLRLYSRLEQLSPFLPPPHWKITYSQG